MCYLELAGQEESYLELAGKKESYLELAGEEKSYLELAGEEESYLELAGQEGDELLLKVTGFLTLRSKKFSVWQTANLTKNFGGGEN